jgi:carbonic anhydrase/acetyltransferase-like protein (isoleucine patch superfamily)
MQYPHHQQYPDTKKTAFIAPSAELIGEVTCGRNVSVWFNATIRADIAPISIGENSNIQDNCVIHVDKDKPTSVGKNVTVGHNAILHACTIGDNSLIGMGAIVLSDAEIGRECIVGAGALVTEGKKFPDRSLIIGSPAKSVRTLTEEQLAKLQQSADGYVEKAQLMHSLIEQDPESR